MRDNLKKAFDTQSLLLSEAVGHRITDIPRSDERDVPLFIEQIHGKAQSRQITDRHN